MDAGMIRNNLNGARAREVDHENRLHAEDAARVTLLKEQNITGIFDAVEKVSLTTNPPREVEVRARTFGHGNSFDAGNEIGGFGASYDRRVKDISRQAIEAAAKEASAQLGVPVQLKQVGGWEPGYVFVVSLG
jgi:hypothetical protein